MTSSQIPQIADTLPPDTKFDTEAFNRCFRAWERRRALPNELAALDLRDQKAAIRTARTKQAKRESRK